MPSRFNFSRSLDFVGSVAANGNPKVFLDGGPTFTEFVFETNIAPDQISLNIRIDGDLRVNITGTQMLDREAYDGRAATAGQYVFSFNDAVAKTLEGEMASGLVTQPGQRVEISVEIGGTVPASPTLTGYVETEPNRPEEFRLYVLPEIIPITKAGENFFANFTQGRVPGRNFIRRFYAYGAVTHLSINQDGRTIFGERELPKAINDARLLRNGKTVPTSSTCYVYDPIVHGNVIFDMLDTFSIQALRANFTTSNTNDVEALTEYVRDVRPVAV